MQISIDDMIDIIQSADLDQLQGDPSGALTVSQIEQIASVIAGKQVTVDPAELAQAQQDWQANNAPAPGAFSPQPAQNRASSQIAQVVANEPPAPPEAKGPAMDLGKGARDIFSDQLDAMLKQAGQ